MYHHALGLPLYALSLRADKSFVVFIYHIVLVLVIGALCCNPVTLCCRLSSSTTAWSPFPAGEGLQATRSRSRFFDRRGNKREDEWHKNSFFYINNIIIGIKMIFCAVTRSLCAAGSPHPPLRGPPSPRGKAYCVVTFDSAIILK